jgi:hypothetical protein
MIVVQGQPPSRKNPSEKRAGGVAQGVQALVQKKK